MHAAVLPHALAATAANGRDLRAHFLLAEVLARGGEPGAAVGWMQQAAATARTLAAQAEPPVPKLAAMWLLRVGLTLCGPLQEVLAGAALVRELPYTVDHETREAFESAVDARVGPPRRRAAAAGDNESRSSRDSDAEMTRRRDGCGGGRASSCDGADVAGGDVSCCSSSCGACGCGCGACAGVCGACAWS